jgi:hypothetical protein
VAENPARLVLIGIAKVVDGVVDDRLSPRPSAVVKIMVPGISLHVPDCAQHRYRFEITPGGELIGAEMAVAFFRVMPSSMDSSTLISRPEA